ncbi:zincin-like metallopeptidase domain-containing protein [Litorimonas sp.]|uniref:zincin-like metallopeptidase domain-containing protein n=1 Tax=Litorimonas sp. TaxID=1892381 RepID=UPI003A83A12B
MKSVLSTGIAFVALTLPALSAHAQMSDTQLSPVSQTASANYLERAWTKAQAAEILDDTMRLRFEYDELALSEAEEVAVKDLLEAGARLHTLYLEQRHPQARAIESFFTENEKRPDLEEIFRIMKGPIATTPDNKRKAFLNVDPETPARNVYPDGLTRADLDAYLEENPDMRDEILDLRAVVKRADEDEKTAALDKLDLFPALDILHPGLRENIQEAESYFALPYSVAYAEDIMFIYDRLTHAADAMKDDDIAFSRFLDLRAVDLLTDNYDGGDAAWVTGDFTGNLNAQIGSYETYDDALYGVKSFFSLSLLQRDIEKSEELAASIGDIQAIEDALPYTANKQVRRNIPVAVYNVIADFGQARGTNTATILPNEGHLSRQYGRTILIRSNVLTNERIFADSKAAFKAAIDESHHSDLKLEGNFYRTLWHEIGHYMGPDQTKDGRDIDAALQDTADLMEEMKADLVSLFSAEKLHAAGSFSDEQLRAIYASGILRVLNKNQPRREQAYGTMQLIQWNWFLQSGVLSLQDGKLAINYELYPSAVESLLKLVLNLQYQGDRDAANAFVDKWTNWDEELHGQIGDLMKAAPGANYRLVTYEALGE